MFTVRQAFRTTMSEVRFEVFNVITGTVAVITRDPAKALRIAATTNGGE